MPPTNEYLVDGKLGARGYLLERDIPILAVPLEDHVHEAQQGDLLLCEGRAAHQGGLRRHRLRRMDGRTDGRRGSGQSADCRA